MRLNYWEYFFAIDRVLISAILNLNFIFLQKNKKNIISWVFEIGIIWGKIHEICRDNLPTRILLCSREN